MSSGMRMEYHYTGVWKDMAAVYRKQGLSEEEIADVIICQIDKLIDVVVYQPAKLIEERKRLGDTKK